MKAYRLVVHDLREARPIELAAEMKHDQRVAEFCRDRMADAPQIASIEVWSDGRKLGHFHSPAQRQAA